jgi:nitrogen fixation/metabolism regulation signal transduction histidine kinase
MNNARKKHREKEKRLALRWHESIVLRAAGIAAIVLLIGYLVSIFIGIQSIDAISHLAHDKEIEETLASHLDQIKNIQALRQKLISERLTNKIEHFDKDQKVDLNAAKVLVAEAIQGLDVDVGDLEFAQSATENTEAGAVWSGKNRLDVLGYSISFPKGNLYKTFKNAEEIVQRYQLVGVELEGNIRPTLIKANTLVLLVGFFLLMTAFFYLARKFRRSVLDVLKGFERWSADDLSFRFETRYQGELGLITSQFNTMAKDIEANRQKTMYLEKIASWQVIARKLAHEIKNPLTPIQMMVSQLHRRYKGEDKEFQILLDDAQSIISEEVAGLKRMVDNFSKFARLPVPTFELIDLVKTIKHVVELQKVTYEQHEISCVGTLNEALAWADDGLIKQVLINLTKNAAEACVEPAKITVGIQDAKDCFLIQVTDNGPGIPEEIRKRIFEAYFTTKHTGPTPGMGLGLAICQKIILDHKGEVTVESKTGQTVFTIRLRKNQKDEERWKPTQK